jgi:hypothetical protein
MSGACLLAIAPFFRWGSPSGHDFEFHMFSWMEVLSQWRADILYPRWAALAHWGYGEARFLFYPPASWTLGAALGSILPWKMVPGVYCWIALALAGAAMYKLAREWLPATDALFAALFYALNPYHLLIVYWRSAYAELLAAALLPLLLLCLVRVTLGSPESGLRWTMWLSLTFAAAWLTNLPAAIMIYYSAAGLVCLQALLLTAGTATRERPPERSLTTQVGRSLVRTGLAMSLGAGLAAFYLIPVVYEQKWVNLSEVLSPGVRPQDNFLFTTTTDPDHNQFNRLVSTIALAEIGALAVAIWSSRRSRQNRDAVGAISDRRTWMLLSVWGTACAVLLLSVSNVFWQHLPKFRYVQLPFRWLLCMNAALAILIAMTSKRWTVRLLFCASLLAVVMIAGYRILPPWWETAADVREMSEAIHDNSGYEGTDEYVPAGDDAYELNKSLHRVSDETGRMVPGKILVWSQIEKHFTVHAAAPQDITVRLFNYPAWEVVVNGKPTATRKTEVTGLMVIPVSAGENNIEIHFRRTIDRLVGSIASLIGLVLQIVAWIKTRKGIG